MATPSPLAVTLDCRPASLGIRAARTDSRRTSLPQCPRRCSCVLCLAPSFARSSLFRATPARFAAALNGRRIRRTFPALKAPSLRSSNQAKPVTAPPFRSLRRLCHMPHQHRPPCRLQERVAKPTPSCCVPHRRQHPPRCARPMRCSLRSLNPQECQAIIAPPPINDRIAFLPR
jgi:hypothetical protein